MIDPVEVSHMVGLPPSAPKTSRTGYLLKIPREHTRDRKEVWRELAVEDAKHLREAYEDGRAFVLTDVDDGVDRWRVYGYSCSWPATTEEYALVGAVDVVETFELWNLTLPGA